jgi:hypothetical protein
MLGLPNVQVGTSEFSSGVKRADPTSLGVSHVHGGHLPSHGDTTP